MTAPERSSRWSGSRAVFLWLLWLLMFTLLPLRAALAQSSPTLAQPLPMNLLTADTSITNSRQVLSRISLPPLFPQVSSPLQISRLQTSGPQASDPPPRKPVVQTPYGPITGRQRLRWFVIASVGPQSLGIGVLSAGLGTARHKPDEYDTHWDGFGKRYGLRLTGVVTSNAMEAGIGALWGEDPRYFRANGESFGKRIENILILTVAARGRDSELHPVEHLAPAQRCFVEGCS
jgi:hypothetical protein